MTDSHPKTFIRTDGRETWEPRPINIHPGFIENVDGSVLVETGKTRVIAQLRLKRSSSFSPAEGSTTKAWLANGWIWDATWLNRSTKKRDLGGKIDGRTQEIQRLIGRSLRSVVDLDPWKPYIVDRLWCDSSWWRHSNSSDYRWIRGIGNCPGQNDQRKKIDSWPIQYQLAAVSVGLKEGTALVDLKYDEDSQADVDLNVVQTSEGELVEVQGTAEHKRFRREQLDELLKACRGGLEISF